MAEIEKIAEAEDGLTHEAQEREAVHVAVLSDSFMVTLGKQGESRSQGYPVDGTVKKPPKKVE